MSVPKADAFFQRVAGSATATLYARPAGSAGPGWVAFVAFAADQPAELTLAQAWSNYLGNPRGGRNGGCFVLAQAPPAAQASWLDGFERAVAERNRAFGDFAYRFLFFGDPTIPAAAVGSVAFSTTDAERPGVVQGLAGSETAIVASQFGISIANSAYLRLDLDGGGLRFAPNGDAGVVLLANKYRAATRPLDGGGDVAVPLAGTGGGTLRFGLQLRVAREPERDDFTLLDVGLKWFSGIGSGAARRIVSLRYPLFGPPLDGAAIPFDVSFDPLRPLARDRTAFTFRGQPERDGRVCAPMESALRDGLLHPLRIRPLAGSAQLVLQRDRVTVDSPGSHQRELVYLAPSGPYALLPGDSRPAAERVMCGTSPLEQIVVDPPGSLLTFHPDQPAYSPLLESPPPPAGAPRLTADYLTAWATVTSAGDPSGPAPLYLAQPQGAALYAHGDRADVPYLVHAETPAAALRDARASASYPLAQYAQLAFGGRPDTFDAAQVARLERAVLSVERRARIAGSGSRPSGGDGPRRVTTPQGFILDLGPDGSWRRIHLGQTSWSPDPARVPPTVTTLAFADPDDSVRGAFQTNQQFLVVTQPRTPWRLVGSTSPPPQPGWKTTFEDALAPQGWPFDIRVGSGSNPGDYRNVLIFKFCDGSLEARVDDVARWTAAGDFNSDPTDVAAWLRDYIEQAKVLAAGPDGDYFRRFVEAVTSPSWRGLLALRADADATLLPQELRGLAAGIDPDRFNAHHVGIDLSFVDTAGGRLAPDGNSSVFATVYYVDPDYAANLAAGASPDLPVPVTGTDDFAFRVLSLKTLFVNAQVTAFASKAQVTLDRLFGEQVSGLTLNAQPAPSSSLVLDGTYENHDGVGIYVFATGADARFGLVSNLWRSLEIVRATFSTLRAPAAGTVLSRFSFQGFLDFATTEVDDGSGGRVPFDLLSFGGTGAGPDPTGSGLPFGELHLDMSFDTASPGSPSFAFLIDQMTFAPTVAQARATSLFARMPLTLTGIVAGRTPPADLGYLPVSPLGLPGAPLGDAWHGLVFTLDLGSAGALAARAGFSAQLLLAWGPASQGNSFRLALGLALPGASPTSRGLSLQGVLKLTIDRLLLYRDPGSGTFVLRLTNVLLSLLGVKLPPGTSTAFIVFGNPDPNQRDTVGWYAAVNRERRRRDGALLLTGGGG
ncbi:hypothetical protein Q5424_13915 [Conexibacter sp. JD483]|uniref:hypothetical protein n=1 Tax=unclassified Conexibacter TaxID=2627773 RepID=UPI0027164CD9|nr:MULTISPECIES: hypothetical protein [unclassified Conexibacter]MDO8185506.1 hypothetical protein [Conexibacter sp. CPCC 205706]MDO8197307.1 hypothetical protein [Conexibacter sp. CPCC 205762]MDR9370193.1 hypothetical protein [Conexibacter sp. JD483]